MVARNVELPLQSCKGYIKTVQAMFLFVRNFETNINEKGFNITFLCANVVVALASCAQTTALKWCMCTN